VASLHPGDEGERRLPVGLADGSPAVGAVGQLYGVCLTLLVHPVIEPAHLEDVIAIDQLFEEDAIQFQCCDGRIRRA
jgi:hypothetical protein